MNNKKISSVLCALALSSTFAAFPIYAQDNAYLVQAFINDQNMDLFISENLNSENLGLKVANKSAVITGSGPISENDVSVCTTVLIDVSTSMPEPCRNMVCELMENKIKDIDKNEEMKIIVFGSETKVLQDFTSDRYDLSRAVSEIEFNGMESALFDTIYNTLPETSSALQPCFFRTVVITDGADYTFGGITKEELFMRLQAETYPIDVICASSDIQQNSDKDLAALTRISGGRYFELYPQSDVSEIASGLSVGDYFWIRAEVPAEQLDGSTRQVDVFDGSVSISFDMKMSIVDTPEPPVTESDTVTSSIAPPVSPSVTLPYSTVTEDEEEESSDLNIVPIILIIAGIAVVIIGAAAAIVIIRKKKQKQSNVIQQSQPILVSESPTTEFFDEGEVNEHYTIKISDISNPSDSRILDVYSDIIIGRAESCTVKFNDLSVSREQCKIAANKNGLAISNLSSTNKTKLNGTDLNTEVLLRPADNIRFGRITLRVDYIQTVEDEAPPQNTPLSESGDGKTQSVFR